MGLLDLTINQINTKGWLAISNLYFDNSLVLNTYNSHGWIGYSPSQKVFVGFSCLDSTDTSIVEDRFDRMDKGIVGMQHTIVFVDETCLQHVDFAQYMHYDFWDETKELPYPTLPTEAELQGMEMDENGLFPGCDEYTTMSGKTISTKCFFPGNTEIPYSGANIYFWKLFYESHNRFKTMINNQFGISDLV